MLVFVLIIGVLGVYISSAFIRLELFASIGVIILSSIGLSILIKHIFNTTIKNQSKTLIKISSIVVMIFLLTIPLVLPEDSNWVDYAKYQPTILNGATNYNVVHGDWPHALNWIKNNTPYDSVFFTWWDYGYWITTIGDRITLADNATLIDHQIERIGYVFFKNADDAWLQLSKPHSAILRDDGLPGGPEMLDKDQLKEIENVLIAKGLSDDDITQHIEELEIQIRNEEAGFDADYVLIFLAGMKLTGSNTIPYYILEGGGDESKKNWFMKIAGVDENKLLESDGHTPKDAYWNTMLGKLTPFRIVGYANPANDKIYSEYQHGLVPVYTIEIKYPSNGDGPFRLVYASPSIERTEKGPITAVLIYEINKNYKN